MRKSLISILIIMFLWGVLCPNAIQANELILPVPGTMVNLSQPFNPPILKGIKVHPEDPFKLEFVLDQGEITVSQPGDISRRDVSSSLLPNELGLNAKAPEGTTQTHKTKPLSDAQLKQESAKLIKYFLAAITTPEKDLWVNLSPYEKDRIVPESFGQTEMGRDLLAQDYLLKQVTASLVYPEGDIGKAFWKKVYEESATKHGGRLLNVPISTFNKVWIVPNKAVVYENAKAGTAYVVESSLKVLTEQDYLADTKNNNTSNNNQIVRDIVIPQLTKEVNEGSNFAQLRQVYHSLILATWYKKKIKDSILTQVYADQNKVAGIEANKHSLKANTSPAEIYQRYLEAFKKGTYNYIKEEQDPISKKMIPRKYFSGGVDATHFSSQAMIVTNNAAMIGDEKQSHVISVEIKVSKDVDNNAKFLQDFAMTDSNGQFNLMNTSPIDIIGKSQYLLLGRPHASSYFVADLNKQVARLRKREINQEELRLFIEVYLNKMQKILQLGVMFRAWIIKYKLDIPAIGVELSAVDLDETLRDMDSILIKIKEMAQAFWPDDYERMSDVMEMALYGAVLSAVKQGAIDRKIIVPLEKKEYRDAIYPHMNQSSVERLRINQMRESYMLERILELPQGAIVDVGSAHIVGIGKLLKSRGIAVVASVLDNAQLSLNEQVRPKDIKQLAKFLGIVPFKIKTTKFLKFEPEVPSGLLKVSGYTFKNSRGEESTIFVKKIERNYQFSDEKDVLTRLFDLGIAPEFLYIHDKRNHPILITKKIEGESWLSIYERTNGKGITIEMVEQLGVALGKLHRAGFIHGDLIATRYPPRFEHIFWTKEGKVKFIDFDRSSRLPIISAWYEDTGLLKAVQERLVNQFSNDAIEEAFYSGYNQKDKAQASPGGIDLNAEKMNLETQNAGEAVKLKMDPAISKQMQEAPGFTPVIINIQPMTNLRLFLGLPSK